MPPFAIGVDIGGTFTDCYLTDGVRGWRGKAPTTPGALADGLVAALDATAADHGTPLREVLAATTHFALGTTAITNCLAEHAGATTGLLVTRGFTDLWTMARGHRLGIEGMSHPLPMLVPRRRVAPVRERIDRDGRILVPLDEDGVVGALDRLVSEEGIEALAVCLLWSFRNPAHERRVADIAAERHPSLQVSCSADLFPVIREYERMTATVLNAYTSRAGAAFFDAVEGRLRAAGLRVPVAVMQSSGGTFGPAEARARPVVLAQSGPVVGAAAARARRGVVARGGPVAGVAAARALAQGAERGDVITADMGGTSFDVAVIHRGEPERRVRADVFGLATAMPMVAVSSIGAG